MKNKSVLILAALASIAFLSSASFAGDPPKDDHKKDDAHSSGFGAHGGDAIVQADGTVIPADYHYKESGPLPVVGEDYQISDDVMTKIRTARKLIQAYGGDSDFIDNDVLSANTHYHLVKSLTFTDPLMGNVELAPGEKQVPIGYTLKNETWLVKDLFEKMDPLSKMQQLLHERLHAYREPDYDALTRFTKGITTAVLLYEKQVAGERTDLTPAQHASIRALVRVIASMNMNNTREDRAIFGSEFDTLTKNGGLVAKGAHVSDSAFVGIGAVISAESYVRDGAEVIGANCYEYRTRNYLVYIDFDFLKKSSPEYAPEAVEFDRSDTVVSETSNVMVCLLDERAHLVDSNFSIPIETFSGDDWQIKNLNPHKVMVFVGKDATVLHSKVQASSLAVDSDSKLISSEIMFGASNCETDGEHVHGLLMKSRFAGYFDPAAPMIDFTGLRVYIGRNSKIVDSNLSGSLRFEVLLASNTKIERAHLVFSDPGKNHENLSMYKFEMTDDAAIENSDLDFNADHLDYVLLKKGSALRNWHGGQIDRKGLSILPHSLLVEDDFNFEELGDSFCSGDAPVLNARGHLHFTKKLLHSRDFKKKHCFEGWVKK